MLADKKASGQLLNSLDFEVVKTIDGVVLNILASDYLKYVDLGRKSGKAPPQPAIKKWMKDRKIVFTSFKDKSGKIHKVDKDQAAFIVARSIGKKGIKPTNVLKKTMLNILQNKRELIRQGAMQDIQELIEKTFVNL